MTWKLILTGKDAVPCEEKIHQFAEILKNEPGRASGIGLLTGKMGIVLFLYYYSLYAKRDEFKDIGFEIISEIFDQIEADEVPHTFCEGLAGVGWGLQHLADRGFVETDIDDILAELDGFSSEVLHRHIEERNFDFLQGATGIGLYLLNRNQLPAATGSLQLLLDRLEQNCIHGPGKTIHWETCIDPSDGTMGCNLSISHGMSAIVNLLTRMARIERFRRQAIPLIEGACRYLSKQQFAEQGRTSCFPGLISPKEQPIFSRLAWCYGDLGVALGFLRSSEATGNATWIDTARKIFAHSANRREPRNTGVHDACVCHGTAGIAHIFNRAFQQTGDKHAHDAALYWLEDTLNHAKYSDGYAGYKMRHPEIKGGWKPEANLLEGIAGIGLVFISAVSIIEPAWDKCLMIGS